MKKQVLLLLNILIAFIGYSQSIPCSPNSINGGFEQPAGCGFCLTDASLVPGWNTTASDNQMEIWNSGFMGTPSYEGAQFVELNANEVSNLFQEICTPCPSLVNWSFAHRGRSGVDVIALKAGPSGGPYITIGTFSDDNSAWGYYTGTYNIPSGQLVTRFLFESVSSTGGATYGNFLDAVNFSFAGPVTVHANSDTTICTGGTATISASGGSTYTWTSIPAGFNSTSQTISVSPTVTTKYVVSTPSCTGVEVTDTAEVIVTSFITASITGNTVICAGDSTTLTASGGGSYLWIPGNSTDSTIKVSPPSATTYTVFVTIGSGCSGSASVVVTVSSSPTGTISGTTSLCKNANSPIISFTGANGTPPYTFTYTINGGANQTVTTVSGNSVTIAVPTTVVGTFTFTLVDLQDSGSTTSCSQTSSGSATITVYPSPVANFSSVEVCLNQTMNFSDSSMVSSGIITNWLWDFGDTSPINTSQNPGHNYSIAGTYIVSLVVNNNNGCKDTVTKNVIVHSMPDAQFSFANICVGENMTFSDLSIISHPDTIQSEVWNFGDGSVFNTNQNPSHNYAGAGTYIVQLLTVSEFGCKDSVSKTVIVNPTPVVYFTADDTFGCDPLCVNFQNLSILTGSAFVKWNLGDGSPQSTDQNPYHCFTNDSVFSAITYSVSLTVTSDSGCVGTLTKNNYISVYPNPEASFTVDPGTASIMNPVISFTNQTTGANSWNWNFGDALLSGTSNDTSSLFNPPSHTYADTGKYTITLTVSNQYGCQDFDYHTIIIEPDFIFYIPNAFTPNGDGINDTFTGKGVFIKDFEMWIFDRWGNQIYNTADINQAWSGIVKGGNQVAQQDVYVFIVKVTDIKGKKHNYKGTVALVK